MESTTFLEHFAEQFEETPADQLTLNTNFRELEEWDSMAVLTIIAMVDSFYGVKLTGDEIRSSLTIGDIFNKVESKL